MLERATFVTTTGTGPPGAPRPPPPPPPPPPWPFWAVVVGWPARQTAYPATDTTISRKTNQMSPRFFDFPEPGGAGSYWPGSNSGNGSGVDGFVVIQGALGDATDYDLLL